MSRTIISISLLPLVFLASSVSVPSQKQLSVENGFRGVILSVISQRCLAPDKVPYIGDDFIDFSDMVARYRLENKGKEDIYYLTDNFVSSSAPIGFVLSRKSKDLEWQATYTPARGRERIFTGDGYKWLLLPRGAAIEFEYKDMSNVEGEHSGSVFLNTEPSHKNRIELISDAFIPNRCPKVGK